MVGRGEQEIARTDRRIRDWSILDKCSLNHARGERLPRKERALVATCLQRDARTKLTRDRTV